MSEPKLSHPKCYGCGHNYFQRPAVPEVNGKPVDGGKCHWCVDEESQPPREPRRVKVLNPYWDWRYDDPENEYTWEWE